MRYVNIKDNQIVDGPRTLPINWENISNFYVLDDQTLKSYGWLPYRFESIPLLDGETYNGTTISIGENEVVEYQQKRQKTEQEISDEISSMWENVRSRRNIELQESDWTQLIDVPLSTEKKQEWQTYRQELRDITSQQDPFNIIWPTKP
jgi:hypothetical protein